MTFRRGVVTVITMITGELDYSGVFGLSYKASNDTLMENILYPETANFVWVIFLVFIPILLSNMLVSEAVQVYSIINFDCLGYLNSLPIVADFCKLVE